jgi:hypothetical protein
MFLFSEQLLEDMSCFLCIPEKQMFTMPGLITMSIAATRMYRTLADFGNSSDVYAILHFLASQCSPKVIDATIA